MLNPKVNKSYSTITILLLNIVMFSLIIFFTTGIIMTILTALAQINYKNVDDYLNNEAKSKERIYSYFIV